MIVRIELARDFEPFWRRMFLTQLPAHNVRLFMTNSNIGGYGTFREKLAKVEQDRGVTMGQLFDSKCEADAQSAALRTVAPERIDSRITTKDTAREADEKEEGAADNKHFELRDESVRISFKVDGLKVANNKVEITEFKAFAAFMRTVDKNKEDEMVRVARKKHFLTYDDYSSEEEEGGEEGGYPPVQWLCTVSGKSWS